MCILLDDVVIQVDFDWQSEGKDGEAAFALLEYDVTLKTVGQRLAAGQSQADIEVLHEVEILGVLQLLQRDKQQFLAFLSDADSRVDDLGLEDKIFETVFLKLMAWDAAVLAVGKASGRRIKGSLTVFLLALWLHHYLDQNLSFELIVLDGILDEVEHDELVGLGVEADVGLGGVFDGEVDVELSRLYLMGERIDDFVHLLLEIGDVLDFRLELPSPNLHPLHMVVAVEPHGHTRLLNCIQQLQSLMIDFHIRVVANDWILLVLVQQPHQYIPQLLLGNPRIGYDTVQRRHGLMGVIGLNRIEVDLVRGVL